MLLITANQASTELDIIVFVYTRGGQTFLIAGHTVCLWNLGGPHLQKRSENTIIGGYRPINAQSVEIDWFTFIRYLHL